MKVKFITLGCKVNSYETNKMAQQFLDSGYEIIEEKDEKKADIYIVNTCTVTSIADRKSRKMLRHYKNENKDSIIIATGCLAQVEKNLQEIIPEIDIIIGNNEKTKIVNILEKFLCENMKINQVDEILNSKDYQDFDFSNYHMDKQIRAIIKVQDGCNNYCTYCKIPYARGSIRSRDKSSIIDEIKSLTNKGISEFIITGIHIASYGLDKDNNYYLIDLLEDINKIDGVKRIRLGSIEPKLFSLSFLERLSKLDKVCSNFHISIQALDDFVLKKMNRKYLANDVIEVFENIKKYYKNPLLSTDIIVGFPYEDDEKFNQTYENLKKLDLYKIHVFKYSKREGTVAFTMPCQVRDDIKDKRSKILIELSDEKEKKYNEKFLGKDVEILTEQYKDGFLIGHSKEFLKVKVKGNKNDINKYINVKIDNENMILPM